VAINERRSIQQTKNVELYEGEDIDVGVGVSVDVDETRV
jgi:hypothetical protein